MFSWIILSVFFVVMLFKYLFHFYRDFFHVSEIFVTFVYRVIMSPVAVSFRLAALVTAVLSRNKLTGSKSRYDISLNKFRGTAESAEKNSGKSGSLICT